MQRYASLLARVLISCLFIVSGFSKLTRFKLMTGLVAAKGFPAAWLFLAAAAAIELLGSASLLTGYKSRVAAAILFSYLIPVTLLFHNFWAAPPEAAQLQQVNFLKNLAIMGGLLLLSAFGPGPLAFHRARPHS